jgi:hypothetical protein
LSLQGVFHFPYVNLLHFSITSFQQFGQTNVNDYIKRVKFMALNQQKIDITDRVTGKLENGQIQLYLENESIGNIELPEGIQMKLEHHYEAEQNKIYQHVSVPDQSEQRYTDCDEGGWC